MKLLIKLPSRSRPFQLMEVVYQYMCQAEGDISILISLDTNDSTITTDMIQTLEYNKNVKVVLGESSSKIDACNRDMNVSGDYDIVLLASDDMVPVVKGYDRIICEKMKELYPDTDGVLWFNDGYRGRTLNTLCILGRKYYERFGYIYHPDYKSFYCDNEFMEVANSLGKQTYFDEVIIRHEHPDNTGIIADELYMKNSIFTHRDHMLYVARRHMGFPKTSPNYRFVENRLIIEKD